MNDVSIYVIAHEESGGAVGPVKIGMGVNPAERLKTLQTGNPKPLVLFAQFATPSRDVARVLEGLVHHMMDETRIAGEWFNTPPHKAVAKIRISLLFSLVASGIEHEQAVSIVEESCEVFA